MSDYYSRSGPDAETTNTPVPPECTCDTPSDSHCPVHFRENQLQEQLIKAQNESARLRDLLRQRVFPRKAEDVHFRLDFSPLEQHVTCKCCATPLAENDLVKDAFKMNTTVSWAKCQLRILADMAEDRQLTWLSDELRNINLKLRTLND